MVATELLWIVYFSDGLGFGTCVAAWCLFVGLDSYLWLVACVCCPLGLFVVYLFALRFYLLFTGWFGFGITCVCEFCVLVIAYLLVEGLLLICCCSLVFIYVICLCILVNIFNSSDFLSFCSEFCY